MCVCEWVFVLVQVLKANRFPQRLACHYIMLATWDRKAAIYHNDLKKVSVKWGEGGWASKRQTHSFLVDVPLNEIEPRSLSLNWSSLRSFFPAIFWVKTSLPVCLCCQASRGHLPIKWCVESASVTPVTFDFIMVECVRELLLSWDCFWKKKGQSWMHPLKVTSIAYTTFIMLHSLRFNRKPTKHFQYVWKCELLMPSIIKIEV